jgi:hypothetical protein
MTVLPTIPARLELKFLITEAMAFRVREAITPVCDPDAHTGGRYDLRTLYFDTPQRHFHRAKLRRDADRLKLRARVYGGADEGPAADAVVRLETKRKTGAFVRKDRTPTTPRHWVDAALGRRAGAEAFAFEMLRHGAEPSVLVRYEREAYVSRVDPYARVTFDRRVRAQSKRSFDFDWDERRAVPLDAGRASGWRSGGGVLSPIVLELKSERQIPFWMASLIRRFDLERTGFSKYSRSVDQLTRRAFAQPAWRQTHG